MSFQTKQNFFVTIPPVPHLLGMSRTVEASLFIEWKCCIIVKYFNFLITQKS